MNRIEAQIRDFLASNLAFIDRDFRLIQKEFYLPNFEVGTRGFIDILAEDSYHNYVIIEIKKSEQTAKEAIHQVIKYAALLKQIYKAKPSEIRICIVSTHWDELIIPFSELSNFIEYPFEGYKIQLDSTNTPIKKEVIQPLKKVQNAATRSISCNQMIYLYLNNESRNQEINPLRKKIKSMGIEDFVLLQIDNAGGKKDIIYQYCIYLVFQKYDEKKLKDILLCLSAENQIKEAEEFSENEIDLLYLLEQEILNLIPINCDTVEAGSPDTFLSMIERQGWQIINIIREGLFIDPRGAKNKILLSEIKGITGEWFTQYHNYSNSKLKLRISKIEEDTYQCLCNSEFASRD